MKTLADLSDQMESIAYDLAGDTTPAGIAPLIAEWAMALRDHRCRPLRAVSDDNLRQIAAEVVEPLRASAFGCTCGRGKK